MKVTVAGARRFRGRLRPGVAALVALAAVLATAAPAVAMTIGADPGAAQVRQSDQRPRQQPSPGTLLPGASLRTVDVSAAASTPVLFGATTPDLPALDRLEQAVRHKVGLYMYYRSWATAAGFDAAFASAVRARGALPEITWEPWDPARGVNQPAYALDRIAHGGYDAYLTRWAREIRAWGHPLVLRFAQEMNGTWYPWAEGVNGNVAGDYAAAWRHVHGVFAAQRATNVTWVWSPNVSYPGSRPLAGLYPGDRYVNRVGLDGYNGGSALRIGGWLSFSQVFGPSLTTVRAITAKSIVLGEVASAEAGGSKAAWITDFFGQLKSNPDISAFTWFNFIKETDWRVQSSTSSTTSFRAGVADPRYG